jgi:signal transduction histidine kinase
LWLAAALVVRSGAFGPRGQSAGVLLMATLLVVVAAATAPGLPSEGFVVILFVVAWLAGCAAQRIVGLLEDLRATREQLAVEAARGERRKLAREVHDVIAHSMTVTLLHVRGARIAVTSEPAQALDALSRAERVGRSSLEDLRRIVHLLAEDGDAPPRAPGEFVNDLHELCANFNEAGALVELHVTGDSEALGPLVTLSSYRVVQESVTNALRHAPGSHVDVHFDVDAQNVSIRVENYGAPTHLSKPNSIGRGLRGMRERVELVGGQLHAGATERGWLVDVSMPVGGDEAEGAQ